MSKGVKYMLIASLFFAVMNVLIKFVPRIPAVEIVFFRSVVSLVLSVSLLKYKRIRIWGDKKLLLVLRGLFGAIGLITFFFMLQEIPLASAVTVQYLSPIFTSILGIWIVKEKVSPVQWIFFAMAFTGILVIQGFDTRVSLLFTGIGLVSAIFSGLAYNMVRKLGATENPLVIVFYFPVVTLPITGIVCLFIWVTPTLTEIVYLVGIGVITQFAQFYLTKAFQVEELSKIASLKYLGIIYALIFGYFIFDESYSIGAFAGIALVLIAVGLNVWFKTKLSSISKSA